MLDVGSRDAGHALELAKRFGCRCVAIDPVTLHRQQMRQTIDGTGLGDQVTAGPLTSVDDAVMPTRVSTAAPSSTLPPAVPSATSTGVVGATFATTMLNDCVLVPPHLIILSRISHGARSRASLRACSENPSQSTRMV